MLLRKLLVVGTAGIVGVAGSFATAENAEAPNASFVDGVSFADPTSFTDRFDLSLTPGSASRFSSAFTSDVGRERNPNNDSGYQFSIVADTVYGMDVAFAQRGRVGFNDQGDIESESRTSEVRLGRGLRQMRDDAPTDGSRWYLFAASEDEALIWGPDSRSPLGVSDGGFALQERVEIGDLQAGVTYEANGWQTSLAYVEREITASAGGRTYNQDERFIGLTLTMRR